MEIIIIINPDGTMSLTVPQGATFADAKAQIEKIQKILGDNGVAIKSDRVEQHHHGPKTQVVIHTNRARL